MIPYPGKNGGNRIEHRGEILSPEDLIVHRETRKFGARATALLLFTTSAPSSAELTSGRHMPKFYD
jgi:hypothetical protein